MARGELPANPETPRWGAFQSTVVDVEETEQLEGVDSAKVVEVEFFGRWYHRRYLVNSPMRPIRVLIPVAQLPALIRELEQREDY
jgi:hypothetical protein